MTIGVDIDEVLFPLLPAVIEFHNERYGTSFKIEDFHHYRWWDVFGISREEAVREYHDFWREGRAEQIHPIEGAIEAIGILSEKESVVAVSLRQNEYENRTRDVLRKYFGSNISDVYLCNHFSSSGERKNKADVCADIGVRLLIDDFLEIARDCSDRGIRFLLFGDYEWNQSKSLPTGVERAKNWREVLEKINDTRHK